MTTTSNNNHPREMAIDIGTKYSAIFFTDYVSGAPFKAGNKYTQSLVSKNPKEHMAFFMNWIRRLKPNLIIYERMLDGIEKLRDRSDYENLWKIFKMIVSYCQENKIEGIPIAPNELKHYRSKKCYSYNDNRWKCESNDCDDEGFKFINEMSWIKHRGLTCEPDELDLSWKEEAKAEGFQWVGEAECNELDAQCLWEYWKWFSFKKDTKWIDFRKKLHWRTLERIIKPAINKSKSDRRFEDNWYLSNKNKKNEVSEEQFKQVEIVETKPTPNFSEKKQKLYCDDCNKTLYRLVKYISKKNPNYCYDCRISRRKI